MSEFAAVALTEESPAYQCNPNQSPEHLRILRARKAGKSKLNCTAASAQARDIARLCHDAVMALRGKVEEALDPEQRAKAAMALRSAVQAWDTACERERIARNRPLPGSLRPESKPKAKVKSQTKSFVESAPAPVTTEPPAAS
jgi:hypothetical protein